MRKTLAAMKTALIILAGLVIVGIGYGLSTQRQTDTASQGKIDINAVCEGSLSYMTFPDGASAEKFVAECKEGKHPEVIERYKAEVNLGDGAQI